MAPGPACSEKSNLGRDPRCGAPPTAQTFLCTTAGGCRQLPRLLLKLQEEGNVLGVVLGHQALERFDPVLGGAH